MTEAELITELIGSYPQYTPTRVASFVTFNDDLTQVNKVFNHVCHDPLSYNTPARMTTLITGCPESDDLSLDFIRFLSRGPFRKFSHLISLEFHNESYVIRCSELGKWPANVLYNFCIATRTPLEYQKYLIKWKKMVDAGVNENLAMALAPFRFNGVDEPIVAPRGYSDHFYFDPSASITNLVNGTFNMTRVSSISFYNDPKSSRPTNVIWGVSSMAERKKIDGNTPLELNQLDWSQDG